MFKFFNYIFSSILTIRYLQLLPGILVLFFKILVIFFYWFLVNFFKFGLFWFLLYVLVGARDFIFWLFIIFMYVVLYSCVLFRGLSWFFNELSKSGTDVSLKVNEKLLKISQGEIYYRKRVVKKKGLPNLLGYKDLIKFELNKRLIFFNEHFQSLKEGSSELKMDYYNELLLKCRFITSVEVYLLNLFSNLNQSKLDLNQKKFIFLFFIEMFDRVSSVNFYKTVKNFVKIDESREGLRLRNSYAFFEYNDILDLYRYEKSRLVEYFFEDKVLGKEVSFVKNVGKYLHYKDTLDFDQDVLVSRLGKSILSFRYNLEATAPVDLGPGNLMPVNTNLKPYDTLGFMFDEDDVDMGFVFDDNYFDNMGFDSFNLCYDGYNRIYVDNSGFKCVGVGSLLYNYLLNKDLCIVSDKRFLYRSVIESNFNLLSKEGKSYYKTIKHEEDWVSLSMGKLLGMSEDEWEFFLIHLMKMLEEESYRGITGVESRLAEFDNVVVGIFVKNFSRLETLVKDVLNQEASVNGFNKKELDYIYNLKNKKM